MKLIWSNPGYDWKYFEGTEHQPVRTYNFRVRILWHRVYVLKIYNWVHYETDMYDMLIHPPWMIFWTIHGSNSYFYRTVPITDIECQKVLESYSNQIADRSHLLSIDYIYFSQLFTVLQIQCLQILLIILATVKLSFSDY